MNEEQKRQLKEALKNLRMATKDEIKPKKVDKMAWTARIILEILLDT